MLSSEVTGHRRIPLKVPNAEKDSTLVFNVRFSKFVLPKTKRLSPIKKLGMSAMSDIEILAF